VRDLYEVLGVDPSASEDEIKKAYRRKARQEHPDAGGDPEVFKEVTAAYEVLKNPEARANYDRYGDPRGPGGSTGGGDPFAGFGDLQDLIDAFFGGGMGSAMGGMGGRGGRGRASRRSGRDAIVDLTLTLEEAAAGVRREVDVTLPRECDACDGSGAKPGSKGATRCSTCGGAGEVQQVRRSMFGQVVTAGPCPHCDGSGRTVDDPCTACRGQGRREVTEQVTVDVPAGVDDGTRLRMSGHGEAGQQGAASGDLYVRVRIRPHEVFEREGHDLHCELRLPMTQAALGAELKVPTLHGEEKLHVPAGTQTGDVLTLRRQGMPKLNGGGQRGDLLVHCRVETPTHLTDRQRELLEQLTAERGEEAPQGGGYRGFLGKLREAFRS
jgi:molecular chaperone DnaJ